MAKTQKFTVSGTVQGVGFRAATQQQASSTGLTGTVRNLPGGDVEVVASGTDDRLADLADWLGHGPSSAVVRHVSTEPVGGASFDGFRVIS